MRGTVPDLPTPVSLLGQLPVVYSEHDFVRGFLDALDEVLAPVLLTLDNFPAYLDPRTAPADFLGWLAGWLAVDLRTEPSDGRARRAATAAMSRYRWRGTRRGLAEAVQHETGQEPQIVETGGATWSENPGDLPPGPSRAGVTVRIHQPAPGRLDRPRLERVVAAEVPAHVAYTVEIVPAGEQP
jgi:phage tail-like protein